MSPASHSGLIINSSHNIADKLGSRVRNNQYTEITLLCIC